jgi:hypothetical protein
MQENYCFKCGSYTRIDALTKLCGTCYECWPDTIAQARKPAAGGVSQERSP